uniref:Kinesin light chain n=1 Tax=Guillardia theta TaxID=55529 RepID=A0A7S4N7W4_GUITH
MEMEMSPGYGSIDESNEFMEQFSHALHSHSQGAPHKRTVTAEAALTDAMSYQENAVQFMRKGRYAEALQFYDKCLKIQLKALGDLHPLVAQTIDFMGVALLRLDRAYDALETFEKSLAIYQHLGGAGKRVDWALTVMHVGQALELQAENIPKKVSQLQDNQIDKLTKEALAKYNMALEVFKVLEREDPDIDIANIMHCKGNVYNIRGQYKEALRHFKYALGDKLQILGENDPSVAWTKNNIANSLKGLGQIDEAIKWYKEALDMVSKHFGHDHPEVAHVHWNLALAYQTKGEMEAERRAAKGRRSFWFRLFFGKGRRRAHEGSDFLKMEKHLVHAFDVFQSRLGQDHTSTMRAKEALMALEELRRD